MADILKVLFVVFWGIEFCVVGIGERKWWNGVFVSQLLFL
jgi:hypothetical protein